MIDRRWLVVVLAVAACNKSAEKRAQEKATSSDFWPDAPKTTTTTGPARAIKYNPDHIAGYTIAIDVGTQPGAEATVRAKMELALAFRAAAAPRARDALIKKLDLDMDAAGHSMTMHLDNDQLTINDNGAPMTLKRGEAGVLDVAAIIDKPFTTLTFSDANVVTIETNKGHPFTALGGDLLDNAMILFPDLPAEPIAPGHAWSIKRSVPVGSNLGRVDVTYNFVYAGDGGCPSAAKACAHFTFTAASNDVSMENQGVTVKASYGFAGKVFFDTARGVIDESRVRMDMDVKADGHSLPMGGTFVVRPVP